MYVPHLLYPFLCWLTDCINLLAIVNTVAVNIGWHISFQIFLDIFLQGFPGSSTGKESMCNAGDPSLIPGFGRSPGEGIGYPLQYSWASLVSQTVKNPPAMQETWVRSTGWEDPLEEGMATHSSILAWRIPWAEKPGGLQCIGSQRIRHNWAIKQQHSIDRHTVDDHIATKIHLWQHEA